MLREWIIVLLGGQIKGFKDVDEAIEHIRNTDDVTRKYQILTLATKKLFNTISSEDILKQNEDGSWMLEGKPLTQLEVKSLKSEAQAIQNTRLWKVLDKDVKYHCNQKMRAATTILELESAKVIEYTWDILKTRLKKMQNVQTEGS